MVAIALRALDRPVAGGPGAHGTPGMSRTRARRRPPAPRASRTLRQRPSCSLHSRRETAQRGRAFPARIRPRSGTRRRRGPQQLPMPPGTARSTRRPRPEARGSRSLRERYAPCSYALCLSTRARKNPQARRPQPSWPERDGAAQHDLVPERPLRIGTACQTLECLEPARPLGVWSAEVGAVRLRRVRAARGDGLRQGSERHFH